MEESGASRAQKQTCQVRLPGVTGNTPAPTAVNNNGAALASASVNVMGAQGIPLSSSQVMAATTRNFVYEGAQKHVERNTGVKVLQLHHVGGIKSAGSTVQGCLSPGTAVDLTWLLVCVRYEVAVCSSCTSRISAGETLTRNVKLLTTVCITFYRVYCMSCGDPIRRTHVSKSTVID